MFHSKLSHSLTFASEFSVPSAVPAVTVSWGVPSSRGEGVLILLIDTDRAGATTPLQGDVFLEGTIRLNTSSESGPTLLLHLPATPLLELLILEGLLDLVVLVSLLCFSKQYKEEEDVSPFSMEFNDSLTRVQLNELRDVLPAVLLLLPYRNSLLLWDEVIIASRDMLSRDSIDDTRDGEGPEQYPEPTELSLPSSLLPLTARGKVLAGETLWETVRFCRLPDDRCLLLFR